MRLEHTDVPARLAVHTLGECQTVASILSRVGDKWTILVVMMLADRPRRFNELKRMIGGVSQRMLTLTLRGLERDGLVTRTLFPTVPPRVDYELTQLGHSLRCPIEALGHWAFANMSEIERARAVFEFKRGNNATRLDSSTKRSEDRARSSEDKDNPGADRANK